MKSVYLFAIGLIYSLAAGAQVQYTAGPALDNNREATMNRMLAGDDNNFYCFRIRSKGKGTSLFVEKYDNQKLQPVFSKEIPFATEDERTKLEDVFYAGNNMYIFETQYDKRAGTMTLYCQMVSATGLVADKMVPITSFKTDHYQFSDFDIFQNPSKTELLVKSSHKASRSEDYNTDFIALDTKDGIQNKWIKTVNQELTNRLSMAPLKKNDGASIIKDISFVALNFDDKENIYYCYAEQPQTSSKEETPGRYFLATINAADKKPKKLELKFDAEYTVNDIKILKHNENEVIVAGYVKNSADRKNQELPKAAFFSFKVNTGTNAIAGKLIYPFDDKMMKALDSKPDIFLYRLYKLDYIFPVGDAIYYVGEQYHEQHLPYRSSELTAYHWRYWYMDVIVTKVNSNGTVEWVKNVPFRRNFLAFDKRVFKEYIAFPAGKSIYIFSNDNPENTKFYEKGNYIPDDLKTVNDVLGSNFVSSQINIESGNLKRSVAFVNKIYCFEPVLEEHIQFYPSASCEFFAPGKNEIYIYTQDKGRDQFGKLTLEP